MTTTIHRLLATAALTLAGAAQAGYVPTMSVDCGGPAPSRTVTVSKGTTCVATGLGQQSTSALTALGYTELDRDSANGNGGTLQITGAGATSGTWSISSNAWNSYEQLFLFVHLGGPQANGLPNPDWFIVELSALATSGTWAATYQYGLSDIALLATSPITTLAPQSAVIVPLGDLPEPASLALVAGAGLLAGLVRRRRG